MKRLALLLGFALLLVFCAPGIPVLTPIATIEAQSFPVTVHAEWSLNPAGDNVTSYSVTLDGGTPTTVQPVLNAACSCVKSGTFSIADSSAHSVSVVAVNQWGQSAPLALAFQVKIAAVPTGGVVKPGA